MMDSLAQQAERFLILADARFFRDLALVYGASTAGAIMSLALMPHLSAFAWDSAEYIKRRVPSAASLLNPYESLLRRSRLRVKLLDDNRQTFLEILQQMERLASLNSRWFMSLHKGVLGPLKRLLQTDLGIYFLNGHVICTTHVAFLNMGLSEEMIVTLSLETLGPYLRETTTAVGRYTRLLFNVLGADNSLLPVDPAKTPVLPSGFRDIKSPRFYDSIAARVALGHHAICILVTSILSLVNSARFFLPIVAEGNDEFVVKTRFVTLFHAVSSMQQLLDQDCDKQFLLPEAVRQLAEILDCEILRFVSEHRGLRNTFLHYGIRKRTASRLSADLPLFGLIEALGNGRSFKVLAKDVDLGIARVSDGLRSLLPLDLAPEGTL